jgi:hypothetical protein
MDRSKYPADWEAISLAVRTRADWRCEWCAVPNRALGYRDRRGYFWSLADEPWLQPGTWIDYCRGGVCDRARVTRIVLTVAHLGAPLPGDPPWRGNPHDKQDVRPENLAALCQRCHLGYDLLDHMRHAAETRRQKRVTQGQTALAL